MNKQIEEMAKHCPFYEEGNCLLLDEDVLECDMNCDMCTFVEALYNAGYRKQGEGENISQMHPSDEFICEKCGIIIRDCCRYEIDEDDGDETCFEFPYKFCPRCGLKVKGGAE